MKFTWVHVLCLIAVGAPAQSFDSGFRLKGFNNLNGRCDNEFGVQTPVIETSRIRIPNFVTPAITQQTCDCVKAIVRPQIKKKVITVPSVQQFFQTPPCPIIQTIPFVGSRNIRVPTFPLPPLKMFTEVVPAPIIDTRNRIFSPTARPVCGLNGNFQGILNGAFLRNSFDSGPELSGSFPGTVGAGFNTRGNGVILSRSPAIGCGFINGKLRNHC